MKKKSLLLLLLPLTLTSCGNSGVPFATIKGIIDNISSEDLNPYYHVSGRLDFNGIVIPVDATFDKTPKNDKFVPYARYNDGFFNGDYDPDPISYGPTIINALASHSYWLRAPLRINKDNFFTTIGDKKGEGSFNGQFVDANYQKKTISLTIDGEMKDFPIDFTDDTYSVLEVDYEEGGVSKVAYLNRKGTLPDGSSAIFNGTFEDGNGNTLTLVQGEKENKTCAHGIIKNIITSYDDGSGTNPPTSVMTYETLPDGGFAFVGNKVHTTVTLDNYPYYPDPVEHPEVSKWIDDEPLKLYQSTANSKCNIRFEYNKDGFLVKESLTSLDYDYKVSSPGQISLIAIYTYKFGE